MKKNVKRSVFGVSGVVIVAAAIAIGIGLYHQHQANVLATQAHTTYYLHHFLPNTTIDGISVAKLTPNDATQKLAARNYPFQVNHQTVFTLKHAKLSPSQVRQVTKQVTALLHQQTKHQTISFKQPNKVNHVLGQVIPASQNRQLKTALAKVNQNRVSVTPTTVIKTTKGFKLQKAKAGNTFNFEKTVLKWVQTITAGTGPIALTAHQEDQVDHQHDKQMAKQVDNLNNASHAKVTVTLAGKEMTLEPQALHQALQYSNLYDDNGIKVNMTNINQKLNQFATPLQTADKSRQFKTHDGSTVTVPAGIYGWTAALKTAATQLADKLSANVDGNDIRYEIPHYGIGYHTDGTDIGNTYVEVSKRAQHEWVYQNGHVILDSEVVTGKPNGDDTPSGVFDIWSKQRNATLRGQNDNGTAYAQPVAYWMPIDNTGVGLHDAPWQPTFGGNWYLTHGSHGCINQPPSFAPKLFAAVTVGEPVIIY